jgi:hypothetical protein
MLKQELITKVTLEYQGIKFAKILKPRPFGLFFNKQNWIIYFIHKDKIHNLITKTNNNAKISNSKFK